MRAQRATRSPRCTCCALERDAHRARARDVEQALRDVLEASDVLARRVDQRRAAPARAAASRAREQLGRHAQRRERRAQLVRQRRHELLAARLLVAQVGDVLEHQDEAGVRAVARAERRRAQHVVVVAPAEEERDLDRLVLALGMREEVGDRRAQAQVVRMAGAELARSGRPSAVAALDARGSRTRPRSRAATTPSRSSTTSPSSMLSITASILAFSSSTASMRVRSIATAAWPASASSSWRCVERQRAPSGRSPCSASTPTGPRTRRERHVQPLAARAACRCRGPAGCAVLAAPRCAVARSASRQLGARRDARRARRSRPPSGSRSDDRARRTAARRARRRRAASSSTPAAAGDLAREGVERGGARLAAARGLGLVARRAP